MQPKLITPFLPLVEGWLRTDIDLKATVIHERLVTHHGFTGNYQRVKMLVVEARPRIAAELAEGEDNPLTGLHGRLGGARGHRPRSIGARRATCAATPASAASFGPT